MRKMGAGFLSIAILLLLTIPGESKDQGVGSGLFNVYCAKCHSRSGQPGVAPGLHNISKRMSQKQLSLIIRNGKNTMPPFGTKLPARQIRELVDFLKNL